MVKLNGQPAEFTFTIDVKRAETGITETFEMVGHVVDQDEQTTTEEKECQ
jgi:hypothetical protein